ncbi:hypothetical protein [Rhodococcus sp. KRD175]|uniref:hypothetical protein n=1 Tax=Rhodococcus sp. KRD175 TaxID=2729729 RepID=UPI001F4939F7|nr:hypothetical protein [Rhodococcus sp. KRD175]
MPAPNLFLIGVRETQAATAFYSDLFEIEPTFTSPHYVAFDVAPGVLLALSVDDLTCRSVYDLTCRCPAGS